MSNPLLVSSHHELPVFSAIKPKHVEEAVDKMLAENREHLKVLLENKEPYTWENLVWPLEMMEGTLEDMWGIVSHLNEVVNTPELYKAYQAGLTKLSLYYTEMMQNEQLYEAILSLANSDKYNTLDIGQRKIIDNNIRDFQLSGITLSPPAKEQYKKLSIELSDLESQFGQNVLKATDNWGLLITERHKIEGLPAYAVAAAEVAAKNKGESGWLLTLDYPCYHAVMTYVDNQEIRAELYKAYSTRASELQSPENDNTSIMIKIMQIRQTLAELLGFRNYAEYALQTRMLKKPEEVTVFLSDLLLRAKKVADEEMDALRKFVKKNFQLDHLEPWDVTYYSEKMLQTKHAFSEEELRPYLTVNNVLLGLFAVTKRLYEFNIKEVYGFDTWHENVRLFELYDANHKLRGKFYCDLYARPNKQGGAWVSNARVRMKRPDGKLQLPVVFLTANFSKSNNGNPNLLVHDEVITLFHEFGHCLHHMLTMMDYPGISSGNGVMWDAIELPSQLMENWCWEKDTLSLMAKHFRTEEPLPDALFVKLKETKNFQAGLRLCRQLEFALFDFELHEHKLMEDYFEIQRIVDRVREKTAVITVPAFNRFQNSFTHIFAGSYAAGYYSYLWSEVLSADVYESFKQNKQVFDKEKAKKFLTTILEPGGSKDFMTLFMDFQGRAPSIDALLRDYHLIS